MIFDPIHLTFGRLSSETALQCYSENFLTFFRKGFPGLPGAPGKNGLEGLKGERGSDGQLLGLEDKIPGDKGLSGLPGWPGLQGLKGERGPAGPIGEEGFTVIFRIFHNNLNDKKHIECVTLQFIFTSYF